MRQAKQKSAEEASALLELLLAAECLIPHKDECSQLVDQLTIEHHEAGTVILAESGDPEPSLYWVSAAAAVLVVLLLLVSRWVVGGWLVGDGGVLAVAAAHWEWWWWCCCCCCTACAAVSVLCALRNHVTQVLDGCLIVSERVTLRSARVMLQWVWAGDLVGHLEVVTIPQPLQ